MTDARSPAPADRRRAPRFQPAFGTTCRLHPSGPAPAEGLVWNLSATGVSVVLADPPQVGDVVAAELVAEAAGAAVPVLLRVVRVRPVRTGDHALAGEFLRPLTPAELAPFVTPVESHLFPPDVGG